MELDRLATSHPDDTELSRLREDVRTTLADLRETLRELRMRCTEERGLAPTLAEHLERFGERYGVMIDFDADEVHTRVALSVENQMLRMAQDLLQLAQRESGATAIGVSLVAEPGRLRLVVRDDGRGVPEEQLGHEAARHPVAGPGTGRRRRRARRRDHAPRRGHRGRRDGPRTALTRVRTCGSRTRHHVLLGRR